MPGMPILKVILCSTRPGRAGAPVASWFVERATVHGKFTVELVDLKEVNLPPIDEPNHPMMRNYQHEHTKAWSRTIAAADAFVFVTPEYNFSGAPALLNALDYLYQEWSYKPAGFVSYGGVSGGTRSVQMTRLTVAAVKMMPIPEQVSIPFVNKLISDGKFDGGQQESAAVKMLDELHRWSGALATLR
jgi:NAD(P)H-dependent FMN reductase